MVKITPQRIYSEEINPVPSESWVEPRSRYRRFGWRKNYLAFSGFRSPHRPARSFVSIPTWLFRLCYDRKFVDVFIISHPGSSKCIPVEPSHDPKYPHYSYHLRQNSTNRALPSDTRKKNSFLDISKRVTCPAHLVLLFCMYAHTQALPYWQKQTFLDVSFRPRTYIYLLFILTVEDILSNKHK